MKRFFLWGHRRSVATRYIGPGFLKGSMTSNLLLLSKMDHSAFTRRGSVTPFNDVFLWAEPAMERELFWQSRRDHLRFQYFLGKNISPENQWLEDEISFWNGPFLGDMLTRKIPVCTLTLEDLPQLNSDSTHYLKAWQALKTDKCRSQRQSRSVVRSGHVTSCNY